MATPDDDELRAAMFVHLAELSARHPDGIRSADVNTFSFAGERVPLVVQPGIWKPRGLSAALTIRTTYTAGRAAA
ncbi:MAG TPA: hypothetical protein VES42_29135 [Pilimelia sp.]|nr:hypothetical protein [Pilimelia sp.]